MTLQKRFNKTIAKLLCVATVFIAAVASAQEYIPKPEYSFLDENSVDVLGGKLTLTSPGVTIGAGDLSLEYTLSSYSGDFIDAKDNYAGANIYNVRKVSKAHGTAHQFFRYIVVRSPAGVIKFLLDENNQYVGMNNSQGSVVESGDDFIVTYPDGTIATFYRTDDENLKDARQLDSADAKILQDSGGGFQQTRVAALNEVTYPNGYTVTLHRIDSTGVSSVTTNTGLQLKYVHTGTSDVTVYGINNAVTYCSPSYTVSCEYESWPNVSYEWSPDNAMDLVFNLVPSELLFSVTDMAGLTTEYHHSPFDAHEGADNYLYPLGVTFVWRISKIVQPSGRTTEYSYGNNTGGDVHSGRRVVEKAVLKSQSTDTYTSIYSVGHGQGNYAWVDASDYILHTSSEYRGKTFIYYPSMGVVLTAFDHYSNTTYNFNYNDWNNEIISMYSPQGTFKYYYDDNKHLIKRTHQLGADENASENIDLIASYPPVCSNPKTCNKPTQFTDGEGNVTDIEYHSESGQIAKITKPAGLNGIRPQTRYTYQQKYAWYKNSSGSLQPATQPVWRLTRESTCQQGAATDNGCANSNDEVVKTYEYGRENEPNNLFLTGVAITADGQTRLTCYENDNYGNRISETRPKGVNTSCP